VPVMSYVYGTIAFIGVVGIVFVSSSPFSGCWVIDCGATSRARPGLAGFKVPGNPGHPTARSAETMG
jgi:hypothetical protein